jgi:hypothetical protein
VVRPRARYSRRGRLLRRPNYVVRQRPRNLPEGLHKVASVSAWSLVYESSLLRVEAATVRDYRDHYLVRDLTSGRLRRFSGESAWSAAAQLAGDIDGGYHE